MFRQINRQAECFAEQTFRTQMIITRMAVTFMAARIYVCRFWQISIRKVFKFDTQIYTIWSSFFGIGSLSRPWRGVQQTSFMPWIILKSYDLLIIMVPAYQSCHVARHTYLNQLVWEWYPRIASVCLCHVSMVFHQSSLQHVVAKFYSLVNHIGVLVSDFSNRGVEFHPLVYPPGDITSSLLQ